MALLPYQCSRRVLLIRVPAHLTTPSMNWGLKIFHNSHRNICSSNLNNSWYWVQIICQRTINSYYCHEALLRIKSLVNPLDTNNLNSLRLRSAIRITAHYASGLSTMLSPSMCAICTWRCGFFKIDLCYASKISFTCAWLWLTCENP